MEKTKGISFKVVLAIIIAVIVILAIIFVVAKNKSNETNDRLEKMAKEEIFDKLKELVVDQLGVEEDEVTMEATMQEDLGADSLDLVDLVMSVEEEFGVKVADEDLENIKTVGDIVNYIEANQ